jgi:hypothetical protein
MPNLENDAGDRYLDKVIAYGEMREEYVRAVERLHERGVHVPLPHFPPLPSWIEQIARSAQ